MRRVEGWGNRASKLIIIGESLGEREENVGQPFCVEETQRVLTADFRWVPIRNIQIGDRLLTISENPEKGAGVSHHANRRFRIAAVTAKHAQVAECWRVITTHGDVLASGDHRFLTKWRISKGAWSQVDTFHAADKPTKRGTRIVFIAPPTEEDRSYEAGWLAGFLDGEGHVLGSHGYTGKNAGHLGFSQNSGAVCEKAEMLVKQLGFELRTREEQRSYTGKTIVRNRLAGGLPSTIQFLSRVRAGRLIKDCTAVIENAEPRNARRTFARVLSRFPIGQRNLVDITTTEGTFIVEGFVAHNCGPAGFRLNEWMSRVGLQRSDAWIDNVYQYRPPQNKIGELDRITIEQWMSFLHERISELEDPYVIVPTGNYALYALTGKGKVHWHLRDGREPRPGILDWRGSILEYTDLRGRVIKCIPTIHPAATFRQPSLERACVVDWERIAAELTFRELRRPVRTHHIYPSLSQLAALHQSACEPGAVLAIDIENPRSSKTAQVYEDDGVTPGVYKSGKRKGHKKTKKVAGEPKIVCIGFALSATESITVPTDLSYWKSDERWKEAWQWIRHLCTSPAEKVLHNGLYDTFFLADHGIRLANWKWDTLYMHHCLDASAPHDLAYCASVDTREPYWKDQAKDPETAGRYTSNWASFLEYNGKDCCVTRELCDIYLSRLAGLTLQGESGLNFYLRHYTPLLEPLLDLSRHGIRVDATKRKYRLMELMANCVDLQDRLTGLSGGVNLYGTTSLSTAKLKKYLYDTLALPKQWRKRKDTGEKTETVDEVAVRRLMERHPTCLPLQATGPLLLEHRRKQTLLHFYKTERIDEDGRYRSSYSPNTEAGRLSSSRNPRGTGSNAQNVDREARDIFLADAGMVGIEVDASQAEARIDYLLIYMLTQDRSVLDKARLRPDEYDQHTENAAAIFNKATVDISKEERYLGKKAVHAAFRDMQGQKLADELLKEGRIYSADQCDKLIKAFRNRLGVGYIEELFRWVRGRIISDRYLENSWGRRLWFAYDRLDDEAYRRGYSFDPQSEVACLINQYGFIPLAHYLKGVGGHINAHVHDSLLFSVPREDAYDAAKFLVESIEQPRTYWGVELCMPATVKVGSRWKMEQEWLRLPTREVFEAAVGAMTLIP